MRKNFSKDVIPVATVDEIKQADERAQQAIGLERLIERAGYRLGNAAIAMLNGAYGKCVKAIIGKGNNGRDGLVALSLLKQRGAKVIAFAVGEAKEISGCDLFIDAAFGTGFRGEYNWPQIEDSIPILSCDVVSGLNASTGKASGIIKKAHKTVTFQAYKPGQLIRDGLGYSGQIEVKDIGINLDEVRSFVFEEKDFQRLYKQKDVLSHKWSYPLLIIGGSPGMYGAPALAAKASLRGGSGMVYLVLVDKNKESLPELDAVAIAVNKEDVVLRICEIASRFKAIVIGPGISRDDNLLAAIRDICERLSDCPILVDADGLYAFCGILKFKDIFKKRTAPTILTPHLGEFKALAGTVEDDLFAQAKDISKKTSCFLVLKTASELICAPSGESRFVISGSSNLATPGTGDVLAGVIGANLVKEMDTLDAISLGAFIHGHASNLGHKDGLRASDMPDLIAKATDELLASEPK